MSKTDLAATDGWKAQAQVLKDMVEHRIKEEERGIFEELGEHFSDAQRGEMRTDFVATKEKLLSADRSRIKKAA